MKIFHKTIACLIGLSLSISAFANNIIVGPPTLVDKNPVEDYVYVQFDLSWENSWRDDENWDAAWIFIKYREVSNVNWSHASLNDNISNHIIPAGYTCRVDGNGQGCALGVFIYRDTQGNGDNNLSDVKIRWEYGIDGLHDNTIVDVSVFAVEMVYIPEGSFYVGDADKDQISCFHEGGTEDPYLIDTEAEIYMGPSATRLWYEKDTPAAGDQFAGDLPADFPKGYSAFYCMKYEISQGQYADFLNKLTAPQDLNRFPGMYGAKRHTITGPPGNRYADRPDRACNFLSWADGAAFADWAALRPMSELEYEKVCRGPLAVVDDEYAWGSDNIIAATHISGPEDGTEVITNPGANCCYNYIIFTGGDGEAGPLRCGIFAVPGATREQAGAGYYGVMQLSDNIWERAVTVGNPEGRAFRRYEHGDGRLSWAGDADCDFWPGPDAVGSGYRGGCWKYNQERCHTADRYYAAIAITVRFDGSGFRCVRSAH